jgi:hypothetical protein
MLRAEGVRYHDPVAVMSLKTKKFSFILQFQ